MMITEAEIRELSAEERIELIGNIWDTLVADDCQMNLTPEEKQIIDQRVKAYSENPSSASPWEDVKNRLLKK